MNLTPTKMKWFLRFYPPYIGAGIKVESISQDWKEMKVSMKLRWYNKNAIGTHFGGSLYSMIDPHFVLMLMPILGNKYIVWDQSATIKFLKPGKGKVSAVFSISDDMIVTILNKTSAGEKYLPKFNIDILNENGDVIAVANKTLYVRQKKLNGS